MKVKYWDFQNNYRLIEDKIKNLIPIACNYFVVYEI